MKVHFILPDDEKMKLKTVYERLTDEKLLKRCLQILMSNKRPRQKTRHKGQNVTFVGEEWNEGTLVGNLDGQVNENFCQVRMEYNNIKQRMKHVIIGLCPAVD